MAPFSATMAATKSHMDGFWTYLSESVFSLSMLLLSLLSTADLTGDAEVDGFVVVAALELSEVGTVLLDLDTEEPIFN